jgi:hypothetical protein
MKIKIISASILFSIIFAQTGFSWFDKTHMAVLIATGYTNYPAYMAIIPDAVKTKVKAETQNHYFGNSSNIVITAKLVLEQVSRYDTDEGTNSDGHLYGAILASISNAIVVKKSGKYYYYEIGFPAHYIGDLSMPLHNTSYDDFNRKFHAPMDGIVENSILSNISAITSRMHPVIVNKMEDIAQEVARIANLSHDLGMKLRRENRQLLPDEAYGQLAESASLLKAVLEYISNEASK